jgi:hypothetical protein
VIKFDPHTVSMPSQHPQAIFTGGTALTVWRVEFRHAATTYQLRVAVQDNARAWSYSPWVAITDAPYQLRLAWHAATAPDSHNGRVTLWIDGVQQAKLAGIDNDAHRLSQVRLGAVQGIAPDTHGTLFFDAFRSWR